MPFIYPTTFEFNTIDQDLISKGEKGRLGLQIMPSRTVNQGRVRWRQRDNYYGLQQMRGLDGAPSYVQRIGDTTYEYEPGVFGEFVDITETELTVRAGAADVPSVPIDITDLTMEADELLVTRELDRKESSVWTLLATGTIQITLDTPNGNQSVYKDTYTTQTYTATTSWSVTATASPMKDFQAVQQLGQAAGHSVDFGAAANAYMTTLTSYGILNNSNANDIGGKKLTYGQTVNSLPEINNLLSGQNLPKISTYDAGYITRNRGPYKKFIPDHVVIVIGKRANDARVGEYLMTRNASNNFKPGSYRYVIDRANGVNGEKRTPASIEIHRGHNGGPVIYYPSAVVIMHV